MVFLNSQLGLQFIWSICIYNRMATLFHSIVWYLQSCISFLVVVVHEFATTRQHRANLAVMVIIMNFIFPITSCPKSEANTCLAIWDVHLTYVQLRSGAATLFDRLQHRKVRLTVSCSAAPGGVTIGVDPYYYV